MQDAKDQLIADGYARQDMYPCHDCNKFTHESKLVRGLCPACAPRCHEEFCDGLLMLQMADLAICDKCGGTYLLNEDGKWILKEN